MGKPKADCQGCGRLATVPDIQRHVWSTDEGYRCRLCLGHWKSSSRYQWWPVRFTWNRGTSSKFFNWHGWQTGWDGLERRVFGQTFHIGALKICLGKDLPR